MVTITFVSDNSAKEGFGFYYLGPMDGCRDCKLKSVCLNLERGSLYIVKALRSQTHDCPETGEKLRVVEVEKTTIPAAMPKKNAIEGGKVTFQEIDCKMKCCANWFRCHPPSEINGEKLTIKTVEGDTDCPFGETVVLVQLF